MGSSASRPSVDPSNVQPTPASIAPEHPPHPQCLTPNDDQRQIALSTNQLDTASRQAVSKAAIYGLRYRQQKLSADTSSSSDSGNDSEDNTRTDTSRRASVRSRVSARSRQRSLDAHSAVGTPVAVALKAIGVSTDALTKRRYALSAGDDDVGDSDLDSDAEGAGDFLEELSLEPSVPPSPVSLGRSQRAPDTDASGIPRGLLPAPVTEASLAVTTAPASRIASGERTDAPNPGVAVKAGGGALSDLLSDAAGVPQSPRPRCYSVDVAPLKLAANRDSATVSSGVARVAPAATLAHPHRRLSVVGPRERGSSNVHATPLLRASTGISLNATKIDAGGDMNSMSGAAQLGSAVDERRDWLAMLRQVGMQVVDMMNATKASVQAVLTAFQVSCNAPSFRAGL